MGSSSKRIASLNHILVVGQRFIGDTLLMIPFLRALREQYPEAKITVLLGRGPQALLKACPYVDHLLFWPNKKPKKQETTFSYRYQSSLQDEIADKETLFEETNDTPTEEGSKQATCPNTFLELLLQIKQQRFNAAFVLKRSFSAAALVAMAGIPIRVGFNTEARGWLLTHPVTYKMDRPEVECYLDLARAYQISVSSSHLEAWWPASVEAAIKLRFNRYRSFKNIGLHLTSTHPGKQWTMLGFRSLIGQLIENEDPTHPVMFHALGAQSDIASYDALRIILPLSHEARLTVWCGQTSLLESLVLLKQLHGVIGVDSGTLHMAAAVGTPVVGLFGPMSPLKWGPAGEQHRVVSHDLPCRPCHLKSPCTIGYACMQELSPQKVLAACTQI